MKEIENFESKRIQILMEKKKNFQHQKTMEMIINFLRYYKAKQYSLVKQLLYDIRTNDLRDILPDLGTSHLFYRTVIDILKRSEHPELHAEALYNLAVILGEKGNIAPLLRHDVLNVILKFRDSSDPIIIHHMCWCLFGIGSSNVENRELVLQAEVLPLALDIFLHSNTIKNQDMAGQILYGMYHLKPIPTVEQTQPLYDHAKELLSVHNDLLKYSFWILHFATSENPSLLNNLNIVDILCIHLKTKQSILLVPLLIIISNFFKISSPYSNTFLPHLFDPLNNTDANARIQTCRTLADYINGPDNVESLFENGMYAQIITTSKDYKIKIREQAVYVILRGFGLGTKEQKRKLTEMNGLQNILLFVNLAEAPFNANLLDCISTLLEDDYEYYLKMLLSLQAGKVFYQCLSSNDQNMVGKAASLLSIIGDSN